MKLKLKFNITYISGEIYKSDLIIKYQKSFNELIQLTFSLRDNLV